MTTVGIIGAGKLGSVLARLSVTAGYRTLIASSANPELIEMMIEVMAPGATAASANNAIREADIVILALPLGKFRSVPPDELVGKIVIDAMNYWPAVDGQITEFETGQPSSVLVASMLPESRVVRTLSHLDYHQLDQDFRPPGAPDRHAIAVAGENYTAVAEVCDLVDRFGFDPVVTGDLDSSRCFGPGSRLFGASASRHDLVQLIQQEAPGR